MQFFIMPLMKDLVAEIVQSLKSFDLWFKFLDDTQGLFVVIEEKFTYMYMLDCRDSSSYRTHSDQDIDLHSIAESASR